MGPKPFFHGGKWQRQNKIILFLNFLGEKDFIIVTFKIIYL